MTTPSTIPSISQSKKTNLDFLSTVGFCSDTRAISSVDANAIISDDGETPLHIAVKNENKEFSRQLINSGADVNFSDKKNNTPLFYALENQDVPLIELLLEENANPNHINGESISPLTFYMDTVLTDENQNSVRVDIIETLLSFGANPIVSKNRLKESPLIYAIQEGYMRIVELIDEHSQTEFEYSTDGENGLHSTDGPALKTDDGIELYALEGRLVKQEVIESKNISYITNLDSNNNGEMDDFRRSEGKIIDYPKRTAENEFRSDNSPLIEAVTQENLKTTEELIDQGHDVNQLGPDGWTPLMKAVAHNNESDIIDALINAGANVNAMTYETSPPITIASFYQRESSSTEIIDRLLEAGANVNKKDHTGQNALMVSLAFHSRSNIIKKYLEHGADLQRKDADGKRAYKWIMSNEELKRHDSDFFERVIKWGEEGIRKLICE